MKKYFFFVVAFALFLSSAPSAFAANAAPGDICVQGSVRGTCQLQCLGGTIQAQRAGCIGSAAPLCCLPAAAGSQGPTGPNGNNGVVGPSGPNSNTAHDTTLLNPLQGQGNCGEGGQESCLEAFLMSILDFVIKIGSIVVILMLVFVGYKFVAAQGAPGEISEARNMLLWTVVGALILLGAKVIALGIMATVQAISTGN